ncbi:MAG: ATP-binding protein [Pseudomonadota bacterium]
MLLAGLAASLGLGEAFARATLADFDRRLTDDLLSLAGLVERGPAQTLVLKREPTDDRYWRPLSGHYWLVIHDGERFRSRSLWDTELDPPAASADGRLTFVTLHGPLGQELRAAVQRVRIAGVAAPATVVAASDAAAIRARIREFRWYAGVSVAGLVLVLFAVVAYQVSYGLRPLRGIVATLARVREGDSRRLEPDAMPDEVKPLAADINALLDHHERMIERARNAAGDLAHALKTPLAVLAAAAERPGDDLPSVVADQTARMRASVERQLTVAVVGDTRSRTPVAEVAMQLASLMEHLYAKRRLEIALDVAPAAVFQGNRADLEEMLGNLLDNACKWATARITVSGRVRGRNLDLRVADDGPGMTTDAALAALGRGVRLDQRVAGSGLGLPIVVDLATSYGGRLTLEPGPARGLVARIELPGSPMEAESA